LQGWLSPQWVAEFMTRFSSPGGRALIAVVTVGLASVLMVPPGMSLSAPPHSPPSLFRGMGRHTTSWPTKGKMRFAGGTLSKGQGRPQANRRFWFYQVKDWRACWAESASDFS
jgi:hypothetical protein